jgi:hypothetical protein
MSELIDTRQNERNFRRQLLATVSTLALTGFISAHDAKADDNADRPIVWIELGGQLDRIDDGQQAFAPPFFAAAATPAILAPMIDAQKQPPHSIGEYGKISFEPTGSNWLVSASIRYGHASSVKHLHYETARPNIPTTFNGHPLPAITQYELGDGQGTTRESHLVADFQAGKDVGLGLFGAKGTSVFSAGVRFAQFTSGSQVTLHAVPTYVSAVTGPPGKYRRYHHFHSYTAIIRSERSTNAIGPSLSWDASQPVMGDSASMTVSFDWGINAAILFGRQRAQTHHQTAGYYFEGAVADNPKHYTVYVNPPVDHSRVRMVTIPNAGGFAGVSFRYASAKVSFGYRGDFFFNAMDTGWDTAKSSTVGFYGPFASVSIGLGG